MTVRTFSVLALACSLLLFAGCSSSQSTTNSAAGSSAIVWPTAPPAQPTTTSDAPTGCPNGMLSIGTTNSIPPRTICTSQTSAETGEVVFKRECEPCHGPRGQSSMPGMNKDAANLASEKIQSKSDDELRTIIRKGKKGSMEMVGHPWLTKQEVDSLVLYIRSLKPGK